MKMCVHSITAFMTAVASGGALCHPTTQRVVAPISVSLALPRHIHLSFARFSVMLSISLSLFLPPPVLSLSVSLWSQINGGIQKVSFHI